MMRRRALLAVTAAAGLLLAGCASATAVDHGGASATWERIADPPFTPRAGAVTAWTGTEALFLGGDTGSPCPPNADCVAGPSLTRDGGAFNPSTGTWRATAPAPEPVTAYTSSVLDGGRLYLWGASHLLAYDPVDDSWTTLDAPRDVRGWTLAPLGDGRLVFASPTNEHGEGADRLYDPDTRAWTTLPPNPLGPMFDRTVTGIGDAVVLTGCKLVPQPGADGPAVLLAAVLDAKTLTWQRLSDSDQLGGGAWSWTGTRLVMAALSGADGGQVGNYGRTVPNGGILDPATGTWSQLPHPPKRAYDGVWPVYANAGPLSAVDGWLYDDDARTWTKIPRPGDTPDRPGDAVWAGQQLIVVGGLDGASRAPGAWELTLAS